MIHSMGDAYTHVGRVGDGLERDMKKGCVSVQDREIDGLNVPRATWYC
jgi:hypothetical protein